MQTLTIAILAGGRSSRMGEDKALTLIAGIPMLERAARTALAVSPRLLILGRDSAPPAWPVSLPATFVPDTTRDSTGLPAGPMPALLNALTRFNEPLLLLACDMPLLTPETLRLLIAAHHAHHATPAAATLALSLNPDGTPYADPTLSIYTPAIAPTLTRLIAEKRGAFQPLLHEKNVQTWPVPPSRATELLNVNTPEALAHAQAILQANPS